jgi:hypothetical protein
MKDNDNPQYQETAREKLSRMGFKEEPWPTGEYSMILFDNCVSQLIEDDATPAAGLVQYDGQQRGSFFLTRLSSLTVRFLSVNGEQNQAKRSNKRGRFSSVSLYLVAWRGMACRAELPS